MPDSFNFASRSAGRPGLKVLVALAVLLPLVDRRGAFAVVRAQTQRGNDSQVDKWIHELESAFGIGLGSSSTSIPTPTPTSTSAGSVQTAAQGPGCRTSNGTRPSGASPNNRTESVERVVFANFVVRNAEEYTVDCWMEDMKLAASAGFDAFALSIGDEPREPEQVANAFSAVSKLNTNLSRAASNPAFKVFLSFNMTSLPCSTTGDASTLQGYIQAYANHTDYFRYNGDMLVSTFAGEACCFGQGNLDLGWRYALKSGNDSAVADVWFVPGFFGAPDVLSNLTVVDGLFSWNSAWLDPDGDSRAADTFDADRSYVSHLGNKTYMAAISLWSFVNRDRSADYAAGEPHGWLFGDRWETLVNNRAGVPLVEVVTWEDDLGQSFAGPYRGLPLPSNSSKSNSGRQSVQKRARNGNGILAQVAPLMKYYINAYKIGSYPPVAQDSVFLWMGLHTAKGNASGPKEDTRDGEWVQDHVYQYALLTAPGNATFACGPSAASLTAPSGLSKVALALPGRCKVQVEVLRQSASVVKVVQREEGQREFVPKGVLLLEEGRSGDLAVVVPVV